MSYGLRVWNASGNLTLDISDRITRYISTHPFSAYIPGDHWNDVYYLDVPVTGIQKDGTWFVVGDPGTSDKMDNFTYEVLTGKVRVHIYSLRYAAYTSGTFAVYRC